ncbi:PIG-L family deacetylase [Jatrophihabitans sp. DSM 44399]|uniref:PIG-L family deacetylase n=1 Tax=Jatrophihabitans lederbergiae TaxID=3075547 RepID=A0ABU2J7T7_9ACTN|nr:PIG-L family deacetylase [Jatrophihabitans sp. DSM 44399]MDT0261037.1 PIG-L family deacetylase [Jatrophihabitans sp. DSM 44399]
MSEYPERALVVFAHPDNVDFAAAGTVALWVRAGVQVTYCMVTDGDTGGQQAEVDGASLAEIRRAEQQTAAALVGVSDVRFLGYPDGALVEGLELRRAITRIIRWSVPSGY